MIFTTPENIQDCKNVLSKSLIWLDLAKCIGIYLMIVAHGPLLVNTHARTIIYSFHMPLFFIISGYLYKQLSLVDTFKRDWVRLLLPYLILNLFGLFYGGLQIRMKFPLTIHFLECVL